MNLWTFLPCLKVYSCNCPSLCVCPHMWFNFVFSLNSVLYPPQSDRHPSFQRASNFCSGKRCTKSSHPKTFQWLLNSRYYHKSKSNVLNVIPLEKLMQAVGFHSFYQLDLTHIKPPPVYCQTFYVLKYIKTVDSSSVWLFEVSNQFLVYLCHRWSLTKREMWHPLVSVGNLILLIFD